MPTPRPPPGFSAALEWLRLYGNLDAESSASLAGPAATEQARRSLLPKDRRKFHKFDPEHPEPPTGLPDNVSQSQERAPLSLTSPIEEPSALADHPHGITSEQLALMRRLRQQPSEQGPWLAVGVAVGVFLLTATAFFVGHGMMFKLLATGGVPEIPSPKPIGEGGLSAVSSARVLPLLDRAMAAEAAKNYPAAIESLENARRGDEHLPGVNYRLASLYARSNDAAHAIPLLDRSIIEGEDVAASYSLRGELTNQYNRTDQSPGDLEKATLLEPFNARYFFVWGEALRRAGKSDRALEQLRRALDRLQEPALLGIYALKVRLTQLELGQEESFAAEMATQLKLAPPPVDWLLTAAGAEMHGGNFPAAAEDLGRVRALIGENETAAQLQDVFFRKFAHEEELEKFFNVQETPGSSAASTTP